MERLRRNARDMTREELLEVIDNLSKLYSTTKAGANWLAKEASRNLSKND